MVRHNTEMASRPYTTTDSADCWLHHQRLWVRASASSSFRMGNVAAADKRGAVAGRGVMDRGRIVCGSIGIDFAVRMENAYHGIRAGVV